MKKILLLFLSICLLISCTLDLTEPDEEIVVDTYDPYMKYPFENGNFSFYLSSNSIQQTLNGTFEFSSLSTISELPLVTLKEDGTALYYVKYGDGGIKNGTWYLNGNYLTLKIENKIDKTNAELFWDKWEEKKAVYFRDIGSYAAILTKISDSYISTTDIYDLWMYEDEYGLRSGYRFLSNGLFYMYYADKTVVKGTYVYSNTSNKIKLSREGYTDIEIVIMRIDDTLYVDNTKYARVSQNGI